MDTANQERTSPSPVTEVSAKARRRRFTAEYKRKILEEADALADAGRAGAIGAMLRREGLYSSHLTVWREQRRRGGLAAKKPGPKARSHDPALLRQLAEKERELAKWKKRARRAEALCEVQKKVSELLGVTLPDPEPSETR